jgi:uncharacterized protein
VRRALAWLAGAVVLMAVITAIGAFAVAHSLTRSWNRPVGPPPSNIEALVVEIDAADHVVAGWFVEPRQMRGAVLLLHGVRGDRTQMVDRLRLFRDAGYAVLAIDLAGHGESRFRRITFGHAESRSAHAAVAWLRNRLPNKKIAVVGMSLGGAAALLGDTPVDVDAVVLEAVYVDIRNATADRIEMMAGRAARPLQVILVQAASLLIGVAPADLRPIARIAALKAPVLIIVGGVDRHAPIADSRALFAAASDPKQLWVIDDAAHTDFERHAPEAYRERVLGFLDQRLGARR